jgi:5-methylcytosine-specific restriction endonuclease McrA
MKSTQFKRTPDGVKTTRMREVENQLGATLEDDYRTHYLEGGLGQTRLAKRWGVTRGLVFGQLRGGRRNWVEMLRLPARGDAGAKKQSRRASKACEICGIDDTVLEGAHWIPAREGGSRRAENILKLCPNCHKRLDHLESPETIERAREILLFRGAEAFFQSMSSRGGPPQRQFLSLCSSILERRRRE